MSIFHPLLPGAPAPAPTPSTTVRRGAKAVVSAADRVLLVKEEHDDGTEFWTLPGGGVRESERLVEGLQRELAEELRCDAVVGEPVSTFWYAHLSSAGAVSRYTVFACAVLSDIEPVEAEGILDTEWFTPAELPSRTLPQVRCLLRPPVPGSDTVDGTEFKRSATPGSRNSSVTYSRQHEVPNPPDAGQKRR